MRKFNEEIDDDLRQAWNDEEFGRLRAPSKSKTHRKTLILGGVGILLLIALIVMFSGGNDGLSREDLTPIRHKLMQLEEKLTRLEGIEDRIVHLEKMEKGLGGFIGEMDRFERSLNQRLDKLRRKLEGLEREMDLVASKIETERAVQKKSISEAKRRYHEVRPLETLYRIAKKYGMSVDDLCRLNNISPKQVIHPGQRLLIEPGDRH